MAHTSSDTEKAPDSNDADDIVETPAAHVETTATLTKVDVKVDECEGLARLTIRATEISGIVLLEEDEAAAVGDRLLTIASQQ